ncbi:hypothetical protein ScPMuIL_014125 [Solemya velum]
MAVERQYDNLLRLLLVGDTGVGKTCLLCRYVTDEFVESHISTIGIDFKMKMLEVDGKKIKIQIWDTAGQERFEAITKQFFRRAQGIMLVYDICNRRSYEQLPRWLNQIQEMASENTVVMMIGNKTDKQYMRQVPYLEAQEFADKYNLNFYETSAKQKNNLDRPFKDMCKEILDVIGQVQNSSSSVINVENSMVKSEEVTGPTEENQKWRCCTIL